MLKNNIISDVSQSFKCSVIDTKSA